MAVNGFAKSKILEIVLYTVAFAIYSFLFYLLGFDVFQYESIWAISAYYIVLNLFTIPTASFFLSFILRHKRENAARERENIG